MAYPILDHLEEPEDLRALDRGQLTALAKDLRQFIIDIVSTKEGHLGASLGVVELTIALHYVFDTPEDKLIWDVGHQAYGHKILTARKNQFHTNRQWNGISGFPKMEESTYDAFGTGHSSTAISAILGMALAAKLQNKTQRQHIAVVGDASIAAGMALEGLNHAGVTDTNMLVILNDNAIGIDPSIGALKAYFTQVKNGTKSKGNSLFEALQFDYVGPIDGHDLPLLLDTLEKLKKNTRPTLLHLITTKGKGLKPAEENQIVYHAPGKFDRKTGALLPKTQEQQAPKYQDVFGLTLVDLAKSNPKIVGITPAMPTGSSLKYMMEAFPDRAWDVGIAEQHAVTLAAGLAAEGMQVYCTIYSTFLQRGYDQLIHDVALQNLPVIFCIDRAGLVGADGATHHGLFDIAFLRCVPNMTIAVARNEIELRNLLYTAQLELQHPIAIRYPRGRGTHIQWQQPMKSIEIGRSECLKNGSHIAVLGVGPLIETLQKFLETHQLNPYVGIYDMRFVKPLDEKALHQIAQNYPHLISLEDASAIGGLGSAISDFLHQHQYSNSLKIFGVPDRFIQHGSIAELRADAGIDVETILNYIENLHQHVS
ncbi:MAG: 1-deoxy-D-xylulose-5-phosphate synthase [Flavobacteriaceae bacterium]|nr:1-deoxy-D-xylulose-5-phosphate synthase [Flavobacteriaceae bacterium]